jgi:pimeloyl-ACP methyl ester carboxylesterase
VGAGPIDLLVAPGFVSHLEHIWRSVPLRATLSRLAGRSRLILFDRRGVGLSDRVGAPPTLAHTAHDLGTVLDAVGSRSAVLFGFSEGGPAAALFAALHPERVRGLLLYGTMARGLRTKDHPWALEEAQFDTWLAQLVARWGKAVPHEAFAPSRVGDRALWTWYAELLRLGSSPGAVRGVLGALKTLDIRPLLPWVEAPTLVLHRTGDRIVRIGAGRYLAAHLPRARLVELDGDDHWWWLGNAGALLDNVERFLDERAAASPGTPLVSVLCALPASAAGGTAALAPIFEQLVAREGGTPLDRGAAPQPGDAARASDAAAAARQHGDGPRWAEFGDPLRALRCARGLAEAGDRSGASPRLGVHCGPATPRGAGPETCAGAALAAATAARPGETLVTARAQAFGAATGFTFGPRRSAAGDGPSPGPWWALR